MRRASRFKLFSCSTQMSIRFILLINVKMPTIVGILTFISRIQISPYMSEKFKINSFSVFKFL